jgi:ATP-binding cassette subfamily B protein
MPDRRAEPSANTPLAQIAGARWRIIRLIPQAGWRLVVAGLLLNSALAALPVTFVAATSVLLGRVPAAVAAGTGSPQWHSLVSAFAVAAAAFMAQLILATAQTPLNEVIARHVDGRIFLQLMRASLASPQINLMDDQSVLDELAEASRELEGGFQSPGRACGGMLSLLARYGQLAGFLGAIGLEFSWWAAAALLATVLIFRYGQRGGLRKYSMIFPRLASSRRESDYLRETATGATAAKEIRVFGLADWLVNRHKDAYLNWMLPVWAERRRIYLRPFIYYTAFGLCTTAIVLAALGRAAAVHQVAITNLALVLQATLASLRLGDHYPEADVQCQLGMNALDAVTRFEQKARAYHATSTAQARPAETAPRPARQIEFDLVSFQYPGQRDPVLDGLQLTIPVGRSTAVVGFNGAGKTTIVKLLAGLYAPTTGTIRIDGADLQTFPMTSWRRHIAVVFQDYLRYESTLADNIGFGAVEHLGDRKAIAECAHDAGLDDVIARLPRGLDTPMARHLPGGMEISGGQWQRVAIARALFALRQGATILVMDEPAASLDVRAEARFYREILQMTRGVTTILISHRFASVRQVDNIVVLADGHVTEQGTHEELIQRDARYAELFRLQAALFADRQAKFEPSTGDIPR